MYGLMLKILTILLHLPTFNLVAIFMPVCLNNTIIKGFKCIINKLTPCTLQKMPFAIIHRYINSV